MNQNNYAIRSYPKVTINELMYHYIELNEYSASKWAGFARGMSPKKPRTAPGRPAQRPAQMRPQTFMIDTERVLR